MSDKMVRGLAYNGKVNVKCIDTTELVEEARKIQLRALNLIKALFIEVSPIPIKAALNLLGMNVGICRMPLVEMSAEGRARLQKAMEGYGLL